MVARRLSGRAVAAVASLGAFAGLGATVVPGPVAGATPHVVAANSPVRGGVLNVLSPNDGDYLDPNITYYSIGYAFIRPFSRQLYSWQPRPHTAKLETVPDLATGRPVVTHHGTRYVVTIRRGARWNTSPARQVRAADVVRGVETSCNSAQPWYGFNNTGIDTLIVGMHRFCQRFAGVPPTADRISRYIRNHDIRGVRVRAGQPRTVVFRLRHRAGYFRDMLTLPVFSPRPREMLVFIPASTQEAQHTISDGPYQVMSYAPTKQLVFARNPAWDRRTDPIRAAYARRIIVSMTWGDRAAVRAMRSGSESADLYVGPISNDLARRRHARHDPDLTLASSVTTNPYLVYNAVSPNNGDAMRKPRVRRALSYALDRRHLVGDLGGHLFAPSLSHALAPQALGSVDFDLYPHDAARAKAMLRKAGARHPTLKFLYRPASPVSVKILQTVQRDLGRIGIIVKGVPSPDADYYARYLLNPRAARQGWWDVAIGGWGPDWYHDDGRSFLEPLFDGQVLPPESSNFGLFHSWRVSRLIDRASHAVRPRSTALWHRADVAVMSAAPFYPIANPRVPTYHAPQLHGYVYLPQYNTGDFTNVWLDPAANGG